MDRLGDFISGFGSRFQNVNRRTLDSIASYIHGLLGQTQRKNIERIAEQKPRSSYQNIPYAISETQWDHRAVIDCLHDMQTVYHSRQRHRIDHRRIRNHQEGR